MQRVRLCLRCAAAMLQAALYSAGGNLRPSKRGSQLVVYLNMKCGQGIGTDRASRIENASAFKLPDSSFLQCANDLLSS
jgi:hypothetical protein